MIPHLSIQRVHKVRMGKKVGVNREDDSPFEHSESLTWPSLFIRVDLMAAK